MLEVYIKVNEMSTKQKYPLVRRFSNFSASVPLYVIQPFKADR
jgi:hypothetical protein